jgi:hypothetical protein
MREQGSEENCIEGLNDLYSSPNIIQVIKLRIMRWSGHAARMGVERCIQGLCCET